MRPCPAQRVHTTPSGWSGAAIAVVVAAMLAAALILAFLVLAPPAHAATSGVEKGISFTGYSAGAYSGSGPRSALRELHATGADWAMVLVTVYQQGPGSTTISRSATQTPTDASLKSIIAYARKLGLKVMLKPQIDLNDGEPRSLIGASFSSAQWSSWFSAYDAMLLRYARLAAATKCQQLSVGCELDATVSHATAWRRTIAKVRKVFHGRLTYAADAIFVGPQVCTWWGKLDLIGIDAYPTLTTVAEPTVAQLVAGWQPFYKRLAALHTRYHKPVVFTEIGVRSVAGAALDPANYDSAGTVDLAGQQRWYRAALQTFAARGWMKGLFLWQWSTYPGVGGAADTSYTPHGKPAGTTLRTWFTKKIR